MPRLPAIRGVIKRRFLINFRIKRRVLEDFLPEPFRPKLHNGFGIGGICLIRLEKLHPKALPVDAGFSSENAAHRFAVRWDDEEGVYVPRRDTDSLVGRFAGGRIFPGVQHSAHFEVAQDGGDYHFSMRSRDRRVEVGFVGRLAPSLPSASCFATLAEASRFFERGCMGYSDSARGERYEGMELRTDFWQVHALDVREVRSSFFEDEEIFPPGSVEFDHALLMENIPHEWVSIRNLFHSGALEENSALAPAG